MKDLIIKGMIFLAGSAIGSVVTWKLVKTKYERIANDEIESMREYYSNKEYDKETGDKNVEESEDGIKQTDNLTVHEIRKKLQELERINERVMEEKKKEDKKDMIGPQVIEPEETWEQDYPMITLTYYEEDQILADDRNKIITNIDELVGEDFADHFGEYEDDTVYIRNDDFKVYYEILRDYGSYAESCR